MTFRQRLIDYTFAGLVLIVPIFFLNGSSAAYERSYQDLNVFDEAVLRVSSPLQVGASWAIESVSGVWNRYVFLVDVEKQNEQVRAENTRLRQELVIVRQSTLKTKELERLIDVRNQESFDTIGARVISASMNPYFRVNRIVLDRGNGEIKPGMPVINGDGLIGRIHRIYGKYADVLLISDTASAIDVAIPRTGGRGVLKGLGKNNSYECDIDYLEHDKQVQVGDLVFTSGLGSSFPEGIGVGRVIRVDRAEYGLFQKVAVQPAVEYSSLSEVLVLLSAPPPKDPGVGDNKSRPVQRAYGVRPL